MDFKFAIGILSTRRSWYGERQPEVFLQHDSHRACQDVLGLQSYPGYHRVRREFSVLADGRHIFGRRPKAAVTDFKTQVFRSKPVVQKRVYEQG